MSPKPAGPSQRGVSLQVPVAAGSAPSSAPLYTQVYRQLREHILSGALRSGARLPSARTLASDLRVSRNTVEAAYLQLGAEGFIQRRVGAGTVVAASVSEAAPFSRAVARPHPGRSGPPPATPTHAPVRLSARGRLIAELGRAEIEADQPIGPCSADVVGFPTQTWNRLLARRARRAGAAPFQSGDQYGLPALREAIADHARLTRGVRCDAHQVLVVNSTQQALDLIGRLLLDPGDIAVVEEPGYPSARAAFLAAGAEVRAVAVDAAGLMAEALAEEAGARLLYVTPSHQFPLGVTMSLARRLALLRWAAAGERWVIEDDYDSEFRYDGRPISSLQGLDRDHRVLYVGTCNKVLFPGLRLAYLIVPQGLVDAVAAGRRIGDGFSSPLSQAVLADFMAGGHFAAYLRQARQHYSACRDLLVGAIEAEWPDTVSLGPSDTGLHLMAHLAAGTNDVAVMESSPTGGIGVTALSRYFYGRTKGRGLLLSYGAVAPERIARSVRAIAPLLLRAQAPERHR
jgi:GntR family transcriptional regulator/MocR family aminotransferase